MNDSLEARGYTLLFEMGMYDWEWDITEIWAKDGRVFALNDSGCSCYSFGDGWNFSVEESIGHMVQVTSLGQLRDYSDENGELDKHIRTLNQFGVF